MRGAELRRWRFRFTRGERRGLAAHAAQCPTDRVVRARHHALLERDDRVVGDVDVLRAHIRAALGDVAVAEPVLLTNEFGAIVRVERMHLERREPYEVARARESRLVLLVVADDVTHVLTEEALDALMELLHALDVVLVHAARAVGFLRLRLERRDRLRPLVVVRDVGHEIADDRERLHRRDGDLLAFLERVHARHAHQLRPAVDLGAARAALSRLAVPAHREVRRLRGLDAMDDVEHDHARVGPHVVLLELTAARIATEDVHLHVRHVTQLPPLRRPSRSASPRRGAPAARSGPRAATRYATRPDRRAAA